MYVCMYAMRMIRLTLKGRGGDVISRRGALARAWEVTSYLLCCITLVSAQLQVDTRSILPPPPCGGLDHRNKDHTVKEVSAAAAY